MIKAERFRINRFDQVIRRGKRTIRKKAEKEQITKERRKK